MNLVFAFCSLSELCTWPMAGLVVGLISTLASAFYFDLNCYPIVDLLRRDVSVA